MKRQSTRRANGAPRVSYGQQLSDAILARPVPTAMPAAGDHEHRWYATKYPDGRKCDECGSWQMWGTY